MRLDHRAGGLALAVGYTLLVVALFRDPSSGLATATDSVQGVLFFLLLPVTGLLSGGYVLLELPFRTSIGFLTGSYLAFVGLAVTLLTGGSVSLATGLGLSLFGLAVIALVATLTSIVSEFVPGFVSEENG